MREEIKFAGILLLLAVFIIAANTFYNAYASPTKSWSVRINDFGEAKLEAFVVFPLTGLLGIAAAICSYKDIKK